VSDSATGALDNASNDANQNMSPAPAGSPVQCCGSAPDTASNQTVSPDKTHWIAIQLVDDDGHVVPSEDYRITLPDGTEIEDILDRKGRAKITGIDPGTCKVSFPNMDALIWKKS
jgi:type VI secretion system secreted protein VgrG